MASVESACGSLLQVVEAIVNDWSIAVSSQEDAGHLEQRWAVRFPDAGD